MCTKYDDKRFFFNPSGSRIGVQQEVSLEENETIFEDKIQSFISYINFKLVQQQALQVLVP